MTRDKNGLLMQVVKQVPRFICEHAIVEVKSKESLKSDSGDKLRGFVNLKENWDKQSGSETSQERLRDDSRPNTSFLGANNVWVEHEDKFMTEDLP